MQYSVPQKELDSKVHVAVLNSLGNPLKSPCISCV